MTKDVIYVFLLWSGTTSNREGNMGLREFFLWQLEHEAAISRAVIERIPEGRNRWKPHAGGMELGQLATLVASTQGMVALLVNRRVLNLEDQANACSLAAPQSTSEEWSQLLRTGLDRSRRALEETTEEHLLGMVRFRQDGQVVNEGPRYAMIAEAAFTQQAQHRGQLAVYLGMLEAESQATPVKDCASFAVRTSIESVRLKLNSGAEFDTCPPPAPLLPDGARQRSY
jgi:hypothetical protein